MTVQTFEEYMDATYQDWRDAWHRTVAEHARDVWQAAHENAAKVCEAERLADALDTPDDIAYNNAVRDCADAIREAARGV